MGVTNFVFEIGASIAKVTYYITIMTGSCLEIVGVSYGTTTVLLHDGVCGANPSK